jgi:hypothetical protein
MYPIGKTCANGLATTDLAISRLPHAARLMAGGQLARGLLDHYSQFAVHPGDWSQGIRCLLGRTVPAVSPGRGASVLAGQGIRHGAVVALGLSPEGEGHRRRQEQHRHQIVPLERLA